MVEKKYIVQPYSIEKHDDTIAFRADINIAIDRAKGLSKDGTIYVVWEMTIDKEVSTTKMMGTAFRGEYTSVEDCGGGTDK